MKTKIRKYSLDVTALTPIHITDGANDDMTPLEYVVTDENLLRHFNLSAFVSKLTGDELNEFTRIAENEKVSEICGFIREFWRKNPETCSELVKWSCHAGDLGPFYSTIEEEEDKRLFLKPFIKTADALYLPGSSVKGSFRTALISCLLAEKPIAENMKNNPNFLEAETLWSNRLSRNKRLFQDATRDPLKTLKVADACFSKQASTVRRVLNVKTDPDKKASEKGPGDSFLMFAECLDERAEGTVPIAIDSRFSSFPNKIGRSFSAEDLFQACKYFTRKLLEHEIGAFFARFDKSNASSDIADLYNDFLKMNEEKGAFLMRIGRYSGRNSTSFNIFNSNGREPKSRNLVLDKGRYLPLGWLHVRYREG